jgi:hypothetical protein
MSRFKSFRSAVCAALCLLGISNASAQLFDRGGGLIYDFDRNITWLADANYAKTSGYDADGRMNWSTANTWAANLVYHDSVRNVDYSDWRLPTALDQTGIYPCEGYNCIGSEMGHLFHTEGGLAMVNNIEQSILSSTTLDDYFTNMQASWYWSSTVYDPSLPPYNSAWVFDNFNGYQYGSSQSNEFYAWAVRPGDVAPIPEPESYAMLLAGLGLLGFLARRRKQQAA